MRWDRSDADISWSVALPLDPMVRFKLTLPEKYEVYEVEQSDTDISWSVALLLDPMII